ncbi:MAG TPA: ABC transporter ATP-binding protein [Firmicutes bacterium]|nr:ABC transporter ATP-binding protein [Bacillota bacterium]
MAYESEWEHQTAPINRSLLRRLLKYLSPHKGKAALATLLMLGVSGVTVVGPYLTKIVIDDYIAAGDLAGLNRKLSPYNCVKLVSP